MRNLLLSLVLAVGVAIGAVALAGEHDENVSDRGWLVEQDGRTVFYSFQDEWFGEPNLNGFTVTNSKKKVTVYYYGNFRVEHREKS